MKLKELIPLIGDNWVCIISEEYQGDTLYEGDPKSATLKNYDVLLESEIVSVHGCTMDDEPDIGDERDEVLIFVHDPRD